MKRVFVSTSFAEDAVARFLSELLAALNVQGFEAIVYRSADQDRIPTGPTTGACMHAAVHHSDLVIALVSGTYCESPYCRNEAQAIVEERKRRDLPVLLARCPTAPGHSLWPEPLRVLRRATDTGERRCLEVNTSLESRARSIERLCAATCRCLEIGFDNTPDPAGGIPLIKRTRMGVQHFLPADSAGTDSGLRSTLDRLREIHKRVAENRRPRGENYTSVTRMLARVHGNCEQRFGPGAAAFIGLAEAVFLLRQAGLSRHDASNHDQLCDRVQVAANDALESGDTYTQRDAALLLGELALETNRPEDALSWYLYASKLARLIEDNAAAPDATDRQMQALASKLPNSITHFPRGASAYTMFANLMKCRFRLLRPLEVSEIDARAEVWKHGGIAYSEPEQFSCYGSLLAFAYAFAGKFDAADKMLETLENAAGKPARVYLGTWRVMLSVISRGLMSEPGTAHRRFWEPTEWLACRVEERRAQSPREAALINHQASRILRNVASEYHGLTTLSRAIASYPGNIRLHVERATLLLALDKRNCAHTECREAVDMEATSPEAVAPFDECGGQKETLYAQGVAYWLLGRKQEAEDRFGLSQASEDTHYSRVLPRAFGAARLQGEPVTCPEA